MQKKIDRLYKNRMKSLEDYNKFLACYYKTQKRQKKQARLLLKVLNKINNAYINVKANASLDEPIELKVCTQEQFDKALEMDKKQKNI